MTRHVNEHWPTILPADMRYTMAHGGAHLISTTHIHPSEVHLAHPVDAATQHAIAQQQAQMFYATQAHHHWHLTPHWPTWQHPNPFYD
mmetsp:Transcript_28122/g.71186  ORF Transcript_28122/g.71186 Transcript_28122/m.71186 type:complete len:88 (+) Transcript_28122:50-313(+)|eukprot:CAMPEP_0174925414 /NCGR_PEP_ID=MMETSP1355-20121228/7890_1 /TAXON_ID=464990 /ORGANISM="Hemiselmis tepida, Strain CCMP443" /LENGTH=87 /DNA_ID=CAMNT_0016171329 /DNA_START=57 /DNA_END=320 /DNA_ORIENTATION=+